MDFRALAFLILTSALIKETRQTCTVEEIRVHEFSPYFRIVFRKYVHCDVVTFSPDFHSQVDPLVKGKEIHWLEVNETHSPEISTGAFSTLTTLPDLRINSANVQVIQPGAFNGLLNLKQLSLKNNKISQLTGNCFTLTSLEVLDLSFNNIVDIADDSFVNLTSLKTLNLQKNSITNLPVALLQNLKNIEVLDMSFNKLSKLDDNLFKNFTFLTKLMLNNNYLNKFSGDLLSQNSRLDTLNINNNDLSSLTDLAFTNTNLILNASHNVIQKVTFAKFSYLQILDLNANGIISLQKYFFDNLSVKQLHLSQNYLGESSIWKSVFSNLSSLESLSLNNNEIKRLDSEVFQNNNKLTELNLSNNYLSQSELHLPKSLNRLSLSNNNFSTNLNLTTLTNLMELDLTHNGLTKISFHFLENLKKLQLLRLGENKINKLDIGTFRDLKSLQELDLSNNNISDLDLGVFVGIDALFRLDLSHNKLNNLNEGVFHNFKSLRYLSLGYNNLSFFNVENTLSHILVLREVDLAGNNWPCPLLMTLIRDFKRTTVKTGDDHNVTNVNGIACRLEPKTLSNADGLPDMFNTVTSKLNTSNNLLICIVLILIVGLTLQYIPPYLKKRKLISTKPKSEQGIPLL